MVQKDLTRRALLKRLGAGGAGLLSAPGAYAALERFARPHRAEAAAVFRRRQEQYLIDSLEAIMRQYAVDEVILSSRAINGSI